MLVPQFKEHTHCFIHDIFFTNEKFSLHLSVLLHPYTYYPRTPHPREEDIWEDFVNQLVTKLLNT